MTYNSLDAIAPKCKKKRAKATCTKKCVVCNEVIRNAGTGTKYCSLACILFNSIDVKDSDSCWPWKRSLGKNGYGRIVFASIGYAAHRLAWMLNKGSIPDRLVVCHKCDNPSCCNPNHLFLGSQKDNVKDMFEKSRNVTTKGAVHFKTSLTEMQAIEIKYGNEKGAVLSRKFGIAPSTVSAIRNGQNWKHI